MGCSPSKPSKNPVMANSPVELKKQQQQQQSSTNLTSEYLNKFKGANSDNGSIDIEAASSINVNVSSRDSNYSDVGTEVTVNTTTMIKSTIITTNEEQGEEEKIIGAIGKIQRYF